MRKRYVQIDGELVEVSREWKPEPKAAYVIPDIQPYQSMATGETIMGRRQHREHLKAHGLVEVGNETDKLKPFGPRAEINWKDAVRETLAQKGML